MPPRILKLEVTTRCNARCVFCSHQDLKREKADMPLDLAERIIVEAADWGIEEVQPQWFGEPLLYPDFEWLVARCKSFGLRVVYYTNGSLPLVAADRIIISVEAHTQDLQSKLRPPLKIADIVRNVEEYKDAGGGEIRFRGIELPENRGVLAEVQAFWSRWGRFVWVPEFPRRRPVLCSAPTPLSSMRTCCRPFEQAVARQDGWLVPCCTDFEGTVLGGNARDGLRQAWEHPTLARFRERVAARDWQMLCETCGYRWR